MMSGGRYFYAVFMAHLAVEKAIKGLYTARTGEVPAKTHNLLRLITATGVQPPEALGRLLVRLNEASVDTRYPEDLDQMEKEYTDASARKLLAGAREVLTWAKSKC